MPMPTAAEIAKLCDEWCSASSVPGGGMAIGGNTEKYRLLANGVVFHELNHEELCAAVAGLSKVLLRPGLNTVVDQDHFGLWSWCGELLLSPRAGLFPMDQHEIKSLYETALHASLAACRKPGRVQRRVARAEPNTGPSASSWKAVAFEISCSAGVPGVSALRGGSKARVHQVRYL